jgi:hypothetical protein
MRIAPLKDADQRRISRNKSLAFQRVKVSSHAPLSAISSYIHNLASWDPSPITVRLYVPFRDGNVQVPVTMTVAEILHITNQEDEGELRYSFIDLEPAPTPARAQPSSGPKSHQTKDDCESSVPHPMINPQNQPLPVAALNSPNGYDTWHSFATDPLSNPFCLEAFRMDKNQRADDEWPSLEARLEYEFQNI